MSNDEAFRGSMGGTARAKALSPELRSEIAAKAAASRWGNNLPPATHRGEIHIGDITIPCYVLEDGRRVLSQRGMIGSLGMSPGGTGGGADRLASFATSKSISPYINGTLSATISSPIKFMTGGQGLVYGYEASSLVDLCDAVLTARKAGALQRQQLHIAEQCEILVRSLARIGIVALVDEVTGYQQVRDRSALQALLDRYLAKELAAWAKRFPDEFYQEIFRLRGWQWKGMKVNRPQAVGKYTNDIIYERIAPAILTELQSRNPVVDNGARKHKHHQFLTDDVGHPALAQHLHAVITLMRISDTWSSFKHSLDRAFPKKGQTLMLPMSLDSTTNRATL
jgi:hypothetical protein